MADIAASGVTYSILKTRTLGDSRKSNRVSLAFGDGTDTFPSAGLTLTAGSMGMPVVVESLRIEDQAAAGYLFQYDQSAGKLYAFYGAYTGTASDAAFAVATHAFPAVTIECEVIGY